MILKRQYALALLVSIAAAAVATVGPVVHASGSPDSTAVSLPKGWEIQSSQSVGDHGSLISDSDYKAIHWYPASVPSTVFATLVEDKVYADPFFGMNLRSIPGVEYPIGQGFSNISMPPGSPFACPWWYRTVFEIPSGGAGKRIWIQFDGINFRADIWMNGRQVASSRNVAGSFRSYEFDVTGFVKAGSTNALAVEIFPPEPHDLQLNWVDVNPTPPDKDMGIWRSVRLVTTGPVALRHADVISHLQVPAMDRAELKLTAELRNATEKSVQGVLHVSTEGVTVSEPVELAAHEDRKVVLKASEFPQLIVAHPRVWWPVRMGKQDLYTATFSFSADGEVSDTQTVQFGIRNVTSELTGEGNRLFRVNGRKVLLRGAGWWGPDMLLRNSPERQEWGVRYAVDLGFNAIRMDGKFEDDHFLDLADRAGLMLLPGWCCCDHWERWKTWNAQDHQVSAESLRDVIRQFRTHPSAIAWLQGDDNPPPPDVEQRYAAILAENDWPNSILSSATERSTTVSGPTGVKMTGPYMWVPPSYWLTDNRYSKGVDGQPVKLGAFGFNTETTPTEAIPPIESIRRMLPDNHLKPVDEFWDYHGGGGDFTGKDVRVFTQAMNARLGPARDLEDYAIKAQLMSYEAQRAMYEAFGRNKYLATGVLHEMLNSAWPSFVWNLCDYYLRPGGSYFGAKKACEALHVQYSYDDRSIAVVNSTYETHAGMHVTAEVYDLQLRKRYEAARVLDVTPDSSTRVLEIPEIKGLTPAYFVRATITTPEGKLVSTNFYWLSTKADELDWDKTTWMNTPASSFADLTALGSLASTQVAVSARVVNNKASGEDVLDVRVKNPSNRLAFFVRLKLTNEESGDEVLPVLWEDNYISLIPGETRTITATYRHKDAGDAGVKLETSGMNVPGTVTAVH